MSSRDQFSRRSRDASFWIKTVLLTGLVILSWIATYTGMIEIIAANTPGGNIGEYLSVAIAFAVLMLQLMIVYILEAFFSGSLRLWLWPLYIFGYILLVIISIGFSFGFYWKNIESTQAATGGITDRISSARETLDITKRRLDALEGTFIDLAKTSRDKSDREIAKGDTCPDSKPGSGPRRRWRLEEAERFEHAQQVVVRRSSEIAPYIRSLQDSLAKVDAKDESIVDPATGTRTKFIEDLNRQLGAIRGKVNDLRRDPDLRQIHDTFSARADQTIFKQGDQTFQCADPAVKDALKGVVRGLDELPEMKEIKIQIVEGPGATLEAFRRLTVSSLSALGIKQNRPNLQANKEGEQFGLEDRDIIPLFIAVFVDLCILLIVIKRRKDFNEPVLDPDKLRDLLRSREVDYRDEMGRPLTESRRQLVNAAVFHQNKTYYAVAPIDFGALHKGAGSDVRRPSNTPGLSGANYVSAILTCLEAKGVVSLLGYLQKRLRNLSERQIHEKLTQQRSPYAAASAFRVFQFKERMWPEVAGALSEIDREFRADDGHEPFWKGESSAGTLRGSKGRGMFSGWFTKRQQPPRPQVVLTEPHQGESPDWRGNGGDDTF